MAEITAVILQASSGVLLGAVLGYAIKKASGAILTLVGLYVASIVALAYAGIVILNWEGLANVVSGVFNWLGVQSSDIISFISSAGVFGASLSAGLLVSMFGLFSIEEPETKKKKFVKRKA